MNNQGVKRMQKDETLENYLETILILTEKKGNIRAIDISNEMNYAILIGSIIISLLEITTGIVVLKRKKQKNN